MRHGKHSVKTNKCHVAICAHFHAAGGSPFANTLSHVAGLVSCTSLHGGICTLLRPSSLSRLLTQASWTYSLEMLHLHTYRSGKLNNKSGMA